MVRRGVRRAILAAMAAAVLTAPFAAFSQPAGAYPPFPHSGGFELINQWLADNTNLTPKQIVLVSAEAAFAFVGTPQATPGAVARTVREEVLQQPLAEALGGRSATLKLEFDCHMGETTVSEVSVYPGSNLSGASAIVPAGRWLAANKDFDLSDLAMVACRKGGQFGAGPAAAAAEGQPTPPVPYSADRSPEAAPARPPAHLRSSQPAPGARWAQIGAYADADIARQQWTALKRSLPGRDQGLGLRLEPVAHGAATLQRALIGPFADGAEAEGFCARIKSSGFGCLVR